MGLRVETFFRPRKTMSLDDQNVIKECWVYEGHTNVAYIKMEIVKNAPSPRPFSAMLVATVRGVMRWHVELTPYRLAKSADSDGRKEFADLCRKVKAALDNKE